MAFSCCEDCLPLLILYRKYTIEQEELIQNLVWNIQKIDISKLKFERELKSIETQFSFDSIDDKSAQFLLKMQGKVSLKIPETVSFDTKPSDKTHESPNKFFTESEDALLESSD